MPAEGLACCSHAKEQKVEQAKRVLQRARLEMHVPLVQTRCIAPFVVKPGAPFVASDRSVRSSVVGRKDKNNT